MGSEAIRGCWNLVEPRAAVKSARSAASLAQESPLWGFGGRHCTPGATPPGVMLPWATVRSPAVSNGRADAPPLGLTRCRLASCPIIRSGCMILIFSLLGLCTQHLCRPSLGSCCRATPLLDRSCVGSSQTDIYTFDLCLVSDAPFR
jgi:hypothetical protein